MGWKKHINLGLLAHVDAGKTTLSEGLLYTAGNLRKIGRVDNKDAFLDTYAQERARGITIFSKQAELQFEGAKITLLDTPGHVDFSTEMERTLQVLDYAILVISALDGVQGHTDTLWKLLKEYDIPTFIFVNKMDQPGTDGPWILQELKRRLDDGCVDFMDDSCDAFYENVAMADEKMVEEYLETGCVAKEHIVDAIQQRKIFPCYFGSALKLQGVERLLQGILSYGKTPEYGENFAARVYKITRDEQGNRLTHLKVTGGSLKVKDMIRTKDWEEKINQIRIYSGNKYEAVSSVEAGTICAVTGLSVTRPGEGLGREEGELLPVLEPVLTYRIILPEGCDGATMLPKLRLLEEEDPMLFIEWKEELSEIHVKLMGEVQTEVLKTLIMERFGVDVTFDEGNIVYKETIQNTVEGVGHFEPLRHYAEVHLLMEPGEPGSGLSFGVECSEDLLDRNWQRLILTHLYERNHKGVLIGAPITDMKITLKAGKAHLKHTEGGDFRQATYRAVRQGLREAQSVLLEPWYDFRLEIPETCVGRAMTDIEKMYGKFQLEYNQEETGDAAEERFSLLTGSAPVATMRGYQKEVYSYTKGRGRIFCALKGYGPCHNAQEIIEASGYVPEADLEHPTGSVFCSHGAGVNVSWDQVKDHMHVESILASKEEETEDQNNWKISDRQEELWIGQDEVDAIINRTFYSNQQGGNANRKRYHKSSRDDSGTVYYSPEDRRAAFQTTLSREKKEEYLLVDGYNIIFAWEELKELADKNIDSARDKLMDILCNYQGYKKCQLMVVFDAYRVKGHDTEIANYHNILVVYTKESETADSYIEKFAHQNSKKFDIVVATSDRLEQMIILGKGCRPISAREFQEEIKRADKKLTEELSQYTSKEKHTLGDILPEIF